jgi:hypothetical protein
MGNTSRDTKTTHTEQKKRYLWKNGKYIKVAKHSQKKEQPDTFVVGIRLPYKYHDQYRNLTIKQRNGLREVIANYLKSLAE